MIHTFKLIILSFNLILFGSYLFFFDSFITSFKNEELVSSIILDIFYVYVYFCDIQCLKKSLLWPYFTSIQLLKKPKDDSFPLIYKKDREYVLNYHIYDYHRNDLAKVSIHSYKIVLSIFHHYYGLLFSPYEL